MGRLNKDPQNKLEPLTVWSRDDNGHCYTSRNEQLLVIVRGQLALIWSLVKLPVRWQLL